MKKRSRGRQKSLKWIRLYLEDFYAIIERLQECDRLTIKTDEWKLEKAGDVETIEDRTLVRNLTISSYQQGFDFNLSPERVGVSIYEDDPKSLGIFTAIVEVVTASQSRFLKYAVNTFSFVLSNLGLILILGLFFPVHLLEARGFSKYEVAIAIVTLSTLTLLSLFFYLMSHRSALFFLQRRSEKRNFFIKNRDPLLVAIIAIIIGAIILGIFNSFGVGDWFQHLW